MPGRPRAPHTSDQVFARRRLARALRDGTVQKPNYCPACRNKATERNPIYAADVQVDPLRVTWRCYRCRIKRSVAEPEAYVTI